jgi:hypothetical protein
MAITRYTHASRVGLFRIELNADGRWRIWCDDELLGSALSAVVALEELTGGHCDWPGTTDPSTLGLPDELSAWHAATTR